MTIAVDSEVDKRPEEPKMEKTTNYWNRPFAAGSHMTEILLKILYIMGYNLKNARNGKSISKIP